MSQSSGVFDLLTERLQACTSRNESTVVSDALLPPHLLKGAINLPLAAGDEMLILYKLPGLRLTPAKNRYTTSLVCRRRRISGLNPIFCRRVNATNRKILCRGKQRNFE
jgi:hypothetical protein